MTTTDRFRTLRTRSGHYQIHATCLLPIYIIHLYLYIILQIEYRRDRLACAMLLLDTSNIRVYTQPYKYINNIIFMLPLPPRLQRRRRSPARLDETLLKAWCTTKKTFSLMSFRPPTVILIARQWFRVRRECPQLNLPPMAIALLCHLRTRVCRIYIVKYICFKLCYVGGEYNYYNNRARLLAPSLAYPFSRGRSYFRNNNLLCGFRDTLDENVYVMFASVCVCFLLSF